MARHVVTFAEQRIARLLLQYLHDHWNKHVNVNDPFLIEAIVAWYRVQTNNGRRIQFNNPFAVTHVTVHYGPYDSHWTTNDLNKYRTLDQGIAGAAKQLIAGAKSGSDQVWLSGALNALKLGGNTGGWQFLSWLAMSSWSPSHFGVSDGQNAADQRYNNLLKEYLNQGGLEAQKVVKKTVTRQVQVPAPPRDLNAPVVVRSYIDPWAAKGFYESRHHGRLTLEG